jgi:hypothetical protein
MYTTSIQELNLKYAILYATQTRQNLARFEAYCSCT